MAEIEHGVLKPYVLKTLTVHLKRTGAPDTDDFSDHVGELVLTPSTSTNSWTSGNGKSLQRSSMATWAAGLGLVQDLSPTGLMRYLLDHEGEQAKVLATFENGTDPCLITVTLSPTVIGAKADGQVAQSTVTLAMDGRPNFNASNTLT